MNRIGALIAAGIAAAVGVLFGVFPELDLAIAKLVYSPGLLASRALSPVRDASMVLVGIVVAPAIGALVLKVLFPHRRMLIAGRTVILLTSTLLIGPGLITNVLLKDYWNRPRPWEVTQLGGKHQFQPWWDPRGTCNKNCSFVAGEVTGAAWTLAPAALAPPAWRAAAYAGALGFAAAVGIGRMMLGGHFFTDVVFAIIFTFLIVWCVHGLLYRWRTRPAEGVIEAAIGRVGLALRRPFGGAGSPA